MNTTDIDDIIGRFQGTFFHEADEIDYHVLQITETINESANLGYNSILYEIKHTKLNKIIDQIKKLWPEISIKIIDKGLFIDWS